MLLEVRHVTQYHYERPVRESVMELRMQPQKSARQRLISFELDLDPRAQVFSYVDSFGNAVIAGQIGQLGGLGDEQRGALDDGGRFTERERARGRVRPLARVRSPCC